MGIHLLIKDTQVDYLIQICVTFFLNFPSAVLISCHQKHF